MAYKTLGQPSGRSAPLTLPMYAGWKFSKVWKHILQHTLLLNRTKSAAAVRFSGMKKRTYEWDSCGGTLHTVAANSKLVVLERSAGGPYTLHVPRVAEGLEV